MRTPACLAASRTFFGSAGSTAAASPSCSSIRLPCRQVPSQLKLEVAVETKTVRILKGKTDLCISFSCCLLVHQPGLPSRHIMPPGRKWHSHRAIRANSNARRSGARLPIQPDRARTRPPKASLKWSHHTFLGPLPPQHPQRESGRSLSLKSSRRRRLTAVPVVKRHTTDTEPFSSIPFLCHCVKGICLCSIDKYTRAIGGRKFWPSKSPFPVK